VFNIIVWKLKSFYIEFICVPVYELYHYHEYDIAVCKSCFTVNSN